MAWNLAIKFLFLCLSGGIRLTKINLPHFVIAKTYAMTCFMGITDNKINSLKNFSKKGEANFGKKNYKLIKIGEIKHTF